MLLLYILLLPHLLIVTRCLAAVHPTDCHALLQPHLLMPHLLQPHLLLPHLLQPHLLIPHLLIPHLLMR